MRIAIFYQHILQKLSLKQRKTFWINPSRCGHIPLLLIKFGITTNLIAQTLPDPNLQLQRQEQQREYLQQQTESKAYLQLGKPQTAQAPQQIPLNETPCALIQTIRIENQSIQNAHFNTLLQKALSGKNQADNPIGRCLGQQGITLIIARLQEVLIEQGYITSQAQVAAQDLKNGELFIQIKAGRIAQINIVGTKINSRALALQNENILNLRDIEQSIENLERLKSISVQAQISPSDTLDHSDLAINLSTQKPLRFSFLINDNGSRNTGKIQSNLSLEWDNPLHLADSLYLSIGQALGGYNRGPRGSENQFLQYRIPIGYWQIAAMYSQNHYEQTLYGPFASYLYHGQSKQAELKLERVLHRSGSSRTAAHINAFMRRSNNYINDLEVLVQRRQVGGWQIGLDHTQYFTNSTLNAQFEFKRGTGAFNSIPAPEEKFSEGSSRMQVLSGRLNWNRPFNLFAHSFNYNSQFEWQHNFSPLTPQDQLCLGGRYSVRGFSGEQTLCGERDQLWQQELSTPISTQKNLHAYLDFDIGQVDVPITSKKNQRFSISCIALGLRGVHTLPKNTLLQYDIFIGQPISNPFTDQSEKTIGGFNMQLNF